MKRYKVILGLILSIFLISFISSAATCYTNSKRVDDSYASATICAEYVSPTLTKGNGYKFYCTSGDLYKGNWNTCDANGCLEEAPSDPYTYYMSVGETLAKLEYTCYDYDSGSDGSWAWAGQSLYYPNVVYKAPTGCASGTEKCTGTSKYVCENGAWINKGVTIGFCNVECINNDTCKILDMPPTMICDGNYTVQSSSSNTCVSNKCAVSTSKKIIEPACPYGCLKGICQDKVLTGFALWWNLIVNWFKGIFK